MSTQLGIIKNTGSRNVDMTITKYFGGKNKGPCIQLTAEQEDHGVGYIQLSSDDFGKLIDILIKETTNE